jgi:hypothetical protein
VCHVSHCGASPQVQQRIGDFLGANSQVGMSQRMFRPAFEVSSRAVLGWPNSLTTWGQFITKSK